MYIHLGDRKLYKFCLGWKKVLPFYYNAKLVNTKFVERKVLDYK